MKRWAGTPEHPRPADLLRHMDDLKNPRGLSALREAILKADPAIEVSFETTNYGNTLLICLKRGERSTSRVVQGEVPRVDRATGERWYKSYDLLGVEEYDDTDEYDEMRAKVVAELVAAVNGWSGVEGSGRRFFWRAPEVKE